jgi:serine/threonine-protein kinase
VSDPVARLAAALGRRYAVERELGRGGMGTVYLARDLKHDRLVALKILPPDIAAALGPERFLREIAISARLSHPNILPLHDSGQAAGLLYYVMPYVEGESLRDRLARAAMPVDEALAIGADVADALEYAHRQGVLHRDVKPENILLAGGHALLADFGVARAVAGSDAEPITDSGLALGTAGYASPEQAAGSRGLDARSDVYSLGCVLYEMLVGSQPDRASAGRTLLERRFVERLPGVHQLNTAVPEWVGVVVERATAVRPGDRFATAGDLRDALRQPATVSLPRRLVSQRLRWMAVGALCLTAVAALAFIPRRTPPADPKQVVVAGFENRTGDSTLDAVGEIATDYIARGLASTHLMRDVYDARVAAAEAGERHHFDRAAARALAARVGAGTVLWGSYYREGDSLQFDAEVVDARTGKLIVSLQRAAGPFRPTTQVVETLRQRVMAGFAVAFGSEFEDWEAGSIAPTYAAYREMISGSNEAWQFNYGEALQHYRRAIALDSAYTGAWTGAAMAAALQRDCEPVESTAERFRRLAVVLPPADESQLEIALAYCSRDFEGALHATRKAVQVVPRSVAVRALGAVMATELLRPKEALAFLKPLDLEHRPVTSRPVAFARSWVGLALHLDGNFAEQLRLALSSGEGRPSVHEVGALAGLGRAPEAERVALSALPPAYSEEGSWSLQLVVCAALELRAHGYSDAGQRVLDRAAAWLGPVAVTSAATPDNSPCMWSHFNASYYAGRWEEARQAYQHRLAEDSTDAKAHAALGALAARRHDQREVERMTAWLASRSNPGAFQARARIAALLGNKEEAVQLLRESFDRGLEGKMFLHLDPDFESLLDFPPYRELIRPKG